MMRGERENFFSREKKPNVGFVILFPLSRHSLGDGGSHPFKKSGILLRPGYPFTPFNSVQLRSKGGWSFSRGHRTCLACRGVELRSNRRRTGFELVTNGD